jgi:putative peptidoglycan lipid II flippase
MASFLRKLSTVSGLTLVSRLAGLARDAALAHVLGSKEIMDSYAMAIRLPNLLRQLLGEGALTAAFIPVFTGYLEKGGRAAANRFMSLMIVVLITALAAITLTGDGLFLLLRYLSDEGSKWHLIFGLSAVLFPFGIMVCLVALLQAALNCRDHFAMPALAPVILNLFIIGGAILAGRAATGDTITQVYLIAGFILLAGIAEIAVQIPAMRRVGLDFHPVWDLKDTGLRRVWQLLGPVVIAVGVVQLNVYMDSLIANLLSPTEEGVTSFMLGPWEIAYPMKIGAASALYYGPLIYQFPLGVFGIALATVIFPVMTRYAVRRDLAGMARTASHALRLTLFAGIPAGVGIILVCEPLIRLMFNHGKFAESPDAVSRTVWVASLFSLGIWAYSANHILIRAFYAMEHIQTPRRVAMMAAGVNFGCNMILVWPMAEGGLALSTVLSAVLQTAVLSRLLSRECDHFAWREIGTSALRTLAATAAMGLATWAVVYRLIPLAPQGITWVTERISMEPAGWLRPILMLEGRWLFVAQLAGGIAVGGAVFVAAAWLMGMGELKDLMGRRTASDEPEGPPQDSGADGSDSLASEEPAR